MKKTLALIFGGEGAESIISEASAAAVIPRFSDNVELLKLGISKSGDWFIFDGDVSKIKDGAWQASSALTPSFPIRLEGISGFYTKNGIKQVDVALPLLHGDFGEDGIIQAALKAAHIPYIGSSVLSSAISSDKAYTKIIAEYLGIPTAAWFIPSGKGMRAVRDEAERRLGYPIFIKPRTLGSSIGAHPVTNRAEFKAAYEDAVRHSCGDIMIERLINVKAEIEFALYGGKKRFISRAGVIMTRGSFYDFRAKYESEGTPEIQKGNSIDLKTTRTARRYSRLLADFLKLGNISRIDFFLTPKGEIYFNEINSVPGMTENSLYPALAEAAGGLEESVVEALVFSEKYQ